MQLLLIFLLIWWGSAVVIWLQESGERAAGANVWRCPLFHPGDHDHVPGAGIGPTHALAMGAGSSRCSARSCWTALLCAMAAAVLIEYKVKEDMGLRMHRFQHHVVLIGWNLKGNVDHPDRIADEACTSARWWWWQTWTASPIQTLWCSSTRPPYPLRGGDRRRAALSDADTIVVLANFAGEASAPTPCPAGQSA